MLIYAAVNGREPIVFTAASLAAVIEHALWQRVPLEIHVETLMR